MASMYNAPLIKVSLNDKDISNSVISIAYEEFSTNQSDTLKIKLFPNIKPTLKDKVVFSINHSLMGVFYIASIAYTYKSSYEIDCTSIDFASSFRTKKSRSFENLSYKSILSSIAKENNLTPKISFDRMDEITHIDQINISDSSLCHHIAKELSLSFCVKNNTLLMLEKDLTKKPTIKINAFECISASLESYAKMAYESVEVSYQDINSEEMKIIRIGKKDPVYKKAIHAQNDDEAYKRAESYYKAIKHNGKKGTLELAGRVIFAGFTLRLSGDRELEGEYIINKVSHAIDSSGWRVSVGFG